MTQHKKRLLLVEFFEKYFLFQRTNINFLDYFKEQEFSFRNNEEKIKVGNILKHLEEIIKQLEVFLVKGNRRFAYLLTFEKALLVVAAYEIIFTPLTKAIAINEILNIAKKNYQMTNYKFLNGVLDQLKKKNE